MKEENKLKSLSPHPQLSPYLLSYTFKPQVSAYEITPTWDMRSGCRQVCHKCHTGYWSYHLCNLLVLQLNF